MDGEKTPLISVVITNFNYAKFVHAAIESVLHQSYKNLEIIFIDDASTDGSRKIYEKFREKIQIIEHKENQGIVKTRNEALKIAHGKYISFLDADDFLDKNYLENLVKIAEKNKADVVYINWRLFGENIDEHEMNFSKDFNARELMRQKIHVSPASLIKLSSIKNHEFCAEKVAEDWDFFIGMALSGKKFISSDEHLNYRQKIGSRGNKNGELNDIENFLEILEKWRNDKKFAKKVISNEEFLFSKLETAIDVREEFSELLKKYKNKNQILSNKVQILEKDFLNTRNEINKILNSRSYNIGLRIGKIMSFSRKKTNKGGKQ